MEVPQLIVVEPYEGSIEFLSEDQHERKYFCGLGLPLAEMAEGLECEIVILTWQEWFPYERRYGWPFTWINSPITRPVSAPDFRLLPVPYDSKRIKRIPIPARNPDHWHLFRNGELNPGPVGFTGNDDISFFLSYCLNAELRVLMRQKPFHAVILPMWGGVGYVPQMSRATGVPGSVDVPFIAVVTDTTLNRRKANQEGIWIRPEIMRRQMEDLSLALADLVFVFGTRGREIAERGRLPDTMAPICLIRHVERSLMDAVSRAAKPRRNISGPIQFFLHEPQDAASGVLVALDGVNLLNEQGVRLERPFISSGPPVVFAPMNPQDFVSYWSTQGFVRHLMLERQWEWMQKPPDDDSGFRIRVYPSLFEHLPNIWSEVSRGSLVMLSPPAAEGLIPDDALPAEILLPEVTPVCFAESIRKLQECSIEKLEEIRAELCTRVHSALANRTRTLKDAIETLAKTMRNTPPLQDLSAVAQLLHNRTDSLQNINLKRPVHVRPLETKNDRLSVVVTCYELGSLIEEAVRSVWMSERIPDEVIVVDDGSQNEETLRSLQKLEKDASKNSLPFQMIRQRNQGLAAARNAGLNAANGEFISFLDGDDLVEPQFYQIALNLIRKYPRLGGVASWAFLFGEGVPDGFWNAPQPEFPFLLVENCVIVPCLYTTALLRELGGYDVRLRYNYEDWELSIRILKAGRPILTVPMYLTRYRIRQNSLFRKMNAAQNQLMRELVLSLHKDIVSKLGVEISMQIENEWKKLAYHKNAGTNIQNIIGSRWTRPFRNLIPRTSKNRPTFD
jgi:glycosyltransferase involved in cell wall biosynthesis